MHTDKLKYKNLCCNPFNQRDPWLSSYKLLIISFFLPKLLGLRLGL
jgi:hypothetical protein